MDGGSPKDMKPKPKGRYGAKVDLVCSFAPERYR